MTSAGMTVAPLNRTLDQELSALIRGASLECLVCGEFVFRVRGALETYLLACPECGTILCDSGLGDFVLAEGVEMPDIELPSAVQAG